MRTIFLTFFCFTLLSLDNAFAQDKPALPDFGARFEDYSKLTPYTKQKIQTIKATPNSVWVGTDKGLFQITGDQTNYVPVIEQSAQYYIQHIYQDDNGKIWTGNHTNMVADLKNNVYRFVQSDGETFLINSIHISNNNMWIGGSKGKIMRLNLKNQEKEVINSVYSGNVNSVWSENGKIAMVARDNGLFFPSDAESGWDFYKNVKSAQKILKIGNTYWVMGIDYNGYSIMLNTKDLTNWTDLNSQLGCIARNNTEFYDFDIDEEGRNLWIGSDRGIIQYNFKTKECNLFSKRRYPDFKMNVVNHLSVQNDSTIWVGSDEGKLFKMTIYPIIDEEEEEVIEEIVEEVVEETVQVEEEIEEEKTTEVIKSTTVAEVETKKTGSLPSPIKAKKPPSRKAEKKKSLVNFDDIQCNETLELSELFFLPNTASFMRGKDAGTYLDILVAYMDANPSATIELYGHTDFLSDNKEYLKELSQKRVNRVREYLIKQGIKKNRISTEAFGGDQPIITDRVSKERDQNRRVEVLIECD